MKVNIINSSCGIALLITVVTKGPRPTELFCLMSSPEVSQLIHMHQTKHVGDTWRVHPSLGGKGSFVQMLVTVTYKYLQ